MEVPPGKILTRSATMCCPNCGHRDLFSGPFSLRETCQLCFMKLHRGSGWFLGPMVINYGITVFAFVLPILALALLGVFPMQPSLITIAAITLIMPLALYRWSWALWLGVYYFFLPDELPANNNKFEHLDS